MKILIVGGNGTIGKVVSNHLKNKHEILIGGRTKGDIQIDIAKTDSIKTALDKIGKLDAIICIAGEAKWAKFQELNEEDYYIGLKN